MFAQEMWQKKKYKNKESIWFLMDSLLQIRTCKTKMTDLLKTVYLFSCNHEIDQLTSFKHSIQPFYFSSLFFPLSRSQGAGVCLQPPLWERRCAPWTGHKSTTGHEHFARNKVTVLLRSSAVSHRHAAYWSEMVKLLFALFRLNFNPFGQKLLLGES